MESKYSMLIFSLFHGCENIHLSLKNHDILSISDVKKGISYIEEKKWLLISQNMVN